MESGKEWSIKLSLGLEIKRADPGQDGLNNFTRPNSHTGKGIGNNSSVLR